MLFAKRRSVTLPRTEASAPPDIATILTRARAGCQEKTGRFSREFAISC
jgi:hypothetical protein